MDRFNESTAGRQPADNSLRSANLHTYTPLQLHSLIRLRDLLRKREEVGDNLKSGDWRLRLLGKAIYSTYRDCLELGVRDDAKALFDREKSGSKG